mmetsp:Transcript_75857/g.235345  ORF Transcript_75857/g.235345 Transcript_75857/m.235345 type:complete len:208 (-) Transcript_75857:405-1028(-)
MLHERAVLLRRGELLPQGCDQVRRHKLPPAGPVAGPAGRAALAPVRPVAQGARPQAVLHGAARPAGAAARPGRRAELRRLLAAWPELVRAALWPLAAVVRLHLQATLAPLQASTTRHRAGLPRAPCAPSAVGAITRARLHVARGEFLVMQRLANSASVMRSYLDVPVTAALAAATLPAATTPVGPLAPHTIRRLPLGGAAQRGQRRT